MESSIWWWCHTCLWARLDLLFIESSTKNNTFVEWLYDGHLRVSLGYSNATDVKKPLLCNAYYLTKPYICPNQIVITICLWSSWKTSTSRITLTPIHYKLVNSNSNLMVSYSRYVLRRSVFFYMIGTVVPWHSDPQIGLFPTSVPPKGRISCIISHIVIAKCHWMYWFGQKPFQYSDIKETLILAKMTDVLNTLAPLIE